MIIFLILLCWITLIFHYCFQITDSYCRNLLGSKFKIRLSRGGTLTISIRFRACHLEEEQIWQTITYRIRIVFLTSSTRKKTKSQKKDNMPLSKQRNRFNLRWIRNLSRGHLKVWILMQRRMCKRTSGWVEDNRKNLMTLREFFNSRLISLF